MTKVIRPKGGVFPSLATSNPKVIRRKGGVFPSLAKSNPKVIRPKGGFFPSLATSNPKVIRRKGGVFPSLAQSESYKKRIRSEFYLYMKLVGQLRAANPGYQRIPGQARGWVSIFKMGCPKHV